MDPSQEYFFHSHVKIYPQFGYIAPSRGEGDHHIMKSHVQEDPDRLMHFYCFSIMLQIQIVESECYY
jgi:hypothetical protein